MLFGFLGQVFVIFVFVFYLLRDDHKIAGWVRTTAGSDSGVVTYLEAVDADLEVVFLGNLLTIVATGTVATGVYALLSILAPPALSYPYSVLLGALTGIATLMPVVGMKIVYVPFSVYLLYRAVTTPAPLWFPIVFFAVSLMIVDTIPDLFIRSYLSARTLHFGLVLLAYTLGALALGWAGLFLGPIILCCSFDSFGMSFPTGCRRARAVADASVSRWVWAGCVHWRTAPREVMAHSHSRTANRSSGVSL